MFEETEGFGKRETIQALASRITSNRELHLGRVLTPKEEELHIRKQIENHVRLYSHLAGFQNGHINGEIVLEFGKNRSSMTLPELKKVLKFIHKKYPIDEVKDNQRVTKKATRWYG